VSKNRIGDRATACSSRSKMTFAARHPPRTNQKVRSSAKIALASVNRK
jgi:hypothetical protein